MKKIVDVPPMKSIVQPMLAHRASQPFDHPDWIFEPLQKGKRYFAHISLNQIVFRDIKNSAVIKVHINHSFSEMILDGVLCTEVDRVDFHDSFQIQKYIDSGVLKFVVYDILHLNTFLLYSVPLIIRKQLLFQLLSKKNALSFLKIGDFVKGTGIDFFNRSHSSFVSGVMAKHSMSHYQPAEKSVQWLKILHGKQAIVRIAGFKFNNEIAESDTFDALVLAEEIEGELRYAGFCTSGFTLYQKERIYTQLMKGYTGKKHFDCHIQTKGSIKWVEASHQCEIRYRARDKKGRLVQPVFCQLLNEIRN